MPGFLDIAQRASDNRRALVRLSGFPAYLLLAFGLVLPLYGGTHVWTGQASNLFSDPANWSGGSPAGDSAAQLTFPSGPAVVALTNDVSALTVAGITFSGAGYTIGGNAISIAGEVDGDSAATINCDLTLNGTTTIAAQHLTINGAIGGVAVLNVNGFGTVFGGSTANSYSGSTIVTAGASLTVSKPAGVIAITGDLRVLGIVDTGDDHVAADAEVIVVASSDGLPGQTRWSVGSQTISALDLEGAAVVQGDGTKRLIVNGSITTGGMGGGRISNALYLQSTRTFSPGTNISIDGVTGASGAGLVLDNVSGAFSGTWTGPTMIDGGSVSISDANTAVTMNGGTTLGITAASFQGTGVLLEGQTLTSDDLTVDAGSTFQMGEPGVAVGPVVHVGGRLRANGCSLKVMPATSFTSHPGRQFSLFAIDGPEPIDAPFAGIPEGALVGDGTLMLTYHGGDGNDIVVTDVRKLTPSIQVSIANGTSVDEFVITVHLTWEMQLLDGWVPPAPTGTVTIYADAAPTATLPASALVSNTIELAPGKEYAITASYSGDALYLPASSEPQTAGAPYPIPTLTAIGPSAATSGEKVAMKLTGTGFFPVAQVICDIAHCSTTFVSSTELYATIDLAGIVPGRTLMIQVLQGGYSNALPLQVNGTLSHAFAFTDVEGAISVTPGAEVAVMEFPDSMLVAALLSDSDGTGVIHWKIGQVSLSSIWIALDFAADQPLIGCPTPSFELARRMPVPEGLFPPDADGGVTRMVMPSGNWWVLWGRPGTGAWVVLTGSPGVPNQDPGDPHKVTLVPSMFGPVGTSPPPPAAFRKGDMVGVIGTVTFMHFAIRVDDAFPPVLRQRRARH